MAKRKTTELTTITAAQLADGDLIPVIDVSDTTMSSTGTNKKLAKSQLAEAAGVTAHLADTSDAHDASAISFSATGNIVATDVQAAIAELDSEKAAVAEPIAAAHIADTSAAHAASAVSFSKTGSISSTDVQAAIAELDSEKAAVAEVLAAISPYASLITDHIADTSAAHAASAVSFSATGSISSTDVQAAIAELDSDLTAHLDDTADAHDASAISVLDTAGNWTATDVEGVLAELPSRYGTLHPEGGTMLPTLRTPTLTIDRTYPTTDTPYEIVWAEGANLGTLYAYGRDSVFRKSTNGGRSWTTRGYTPNQANYAGVFLKLRQGGTGQLLTAVFVDGPVPTQLWRSTDDGATWNKVFDHRNTDTQFLATTSLAEDLVTGHVYLVEYNANATPATTDGAQIWRSTDKGATWNTWYTFPAPSTGTFDAPRHAHTAQWDPISQRVYFSCGDRNPGGGIYRVNAGGTGIEKVVTNFDLDGLLTGGTGAMAPINMLFFPTHIAWGSDGEVGHIYRLARDKIGIATPADIEQIHRMNSTSWFAIRAADDNSAWILTASTENPGIGRPRIDGAVHMYLVTENGSRVQELAAWASEHSAFATITAVGTPEVNGNIMWFKTHNSGLYRRYQWRGRLSYAGVATLPTPDMADVRHHHHWRTHSTGNLTVPAGGSVVFGAAMVPNVIGQTPPQWFRVIDWGWHLVSGTGTVRIEVWNRSTNTLLTSWDQRTGYAGSGANRWYEHFLYQAQLNPSTIVEFRAVETGGVNNATGAGFITWSFGENRAVSAD